MPDSAPPGFDAYSPAEVAHRVEQIGVVKANMPLLRMGALAVLAGAFIALGSVFFLTVTTGVQGGYGPGQLMGGLVFSLGLILVIVGGAELFTGNNLLVMALVSRKISLSLLLRNWLVVFAGNFLGAATVAAMAYLAGHWSGDNNLVGVRALGVGIAKVSLPFWVAFWRAVLCNVLVCLAVWLTQAARTVTDKILAVVFPVSAFVAAGFEHSVANMFFIPYALMVKSEGAVTTAGNLAAPSLARLNAAGLLGNLVPVTLGNIVGGALLVGLVYWACYLWDGHGKGRGSKAA